MGLGLNGLVYKASGPAESLGVKRFWFIREIDGERYRKWRLEDKAKGQTSYDISFAQTTDLIESLARNLDESRKKFRKLGKLLDKGDPKRRKLVSSSSQSTSRTDSE